MAPERLRMTYMSFHYKVVEMKLNKKQMNYA